MDSLPLPVDLKVKLMENMSGKEIMNLYFKDEKFKDLCEDTRADLLWKKKLQEDFGIVKEKDNFTAYIVIFIEKEIENLKEEREKFNLRFANKRRETFKKKWNEDCEDVVLKYQKLVDSCCEQGGRGYRIWIPLSSHTHHWVVSEKKYNDCQPTEKDKDAYFALYGRKMIVTERPHIESWGN